MKKQVCDSGSDSSPRPWSNSSFRCTPPLLSGILFFRFRISDVGLRVKSSRFGKRFASPVKQFALRVHPPHFSAFCFGCRVSDVGLRVEGA